MLVFIPGVAALGLGLLYAAGAIIKSGQLRDADLSVRDTLPLIPLEQILAVGIGTLVTSLLWVLLFALALLVFVGTSTTGPKPPVLLSLKSRKAILSWKSFVILSRIALVAVIVNAFYSYAFFSAVALAAAVLLGYAVERFGAPRGRRYVVYVVMAYFFIVLMARTADAYISPTPLPNVTLTMRSSGESQPKYVQGTLIVNAGGVWYVSLRKQTYRGIPASRVMTAVVRSRSKREPRPVLKILKEKIESWF